MTKELALVLDVGTTGIKAIVFNQDHTVVTKSYRTLRKQISHQGVIIEQDPKAIIQTSIDLLQEAAKAAGLTAENCLGLAITNQRETVVVWDKQTGEPIYPAIVWEDSRTKARCSKIARTHNTQVRELTGLPIDSYFSASKIQWILENIPANQETLCAGTIDTWLLWNLLEGSPHLTDFTNAARTLLFNIQTKTWDVRLLEIWSVPIELLPQVQHSLSNFGSLKSSILGFPLSVVAVCGDQQASMYAVNKRDAKTKVTHGTGTFLLQEVGDTFQLHEEFFTTLTPTKTKPVFALEAKVGTYGARAACLLDKHGPLDSLINEIVQATTVMIKKLPSQPSKIILDGGITREPSLLSTQAKLLPTINFELQETYDGTALGVAEMIFDTKV